MFVSVCVLSSLSRVAQAARLFERGWLDLEAHHFDEMADGQKAREMGRRFERVSLRKYFLPHTGPEVDQAKLAGSMEFWLVSGRADIVGGGNCLSALRCAMLSVRRVIHRVLFGTTHFNNDYYYTAGCARSV